MAGGTGQRARTGEQRIVEKQLPQSHFRRIGCRIIGIGHGVRQVGRLGGTSHQQQGQQETHYDTSITSFCT